MYVEFRLFATFSTVLSLILILTTQLTLPIPKWPIDNHCTCEVFHMSLEAVSMTLSLSTECEWTLEQTRTSNVQQSHTQERSTFPSASKRKIENEKENDTTSCQIFRQPFLSNPPPLFFWFLILFSLSLPNESLSVSRGPPHPSSFTLFFLPLLLKKKKSQTLFHKKIK